MAKKSTGKYVDGFVLVVKKGQVNEYKKLAKIASSVWRKFGALEYKECMLDDAKPQFVTLTFPKLTKVKAGESVWFSFIVYKSRKQRDEVNKKVMDYFSKKYGNMKDKPMPWDMKRFTYGGFTAEVEA